MIATIQSGVPVARIELLDALQMRAINAYSKLDYPEAPTLFFEFHGTPASVEEQARMVADSPRATAAAPFRGRPAPRSAPGSGSAPRRLLVAAGAASRRRGRATDVCVPISRLAERSSPPRRTRPPTGLVAPIVGHVGDGNFHMIFLFDPNDPDELAAR